MHTVLLQKYYSAATGDFGLLPYAIEVKSGGREIKSMININGMLMEMESELSCITISYSCHRDLDKQWNCRWSHSGMGKSHSENGSNPGDTIYEAYGAFENWRNELTAREGKTKGDGNGTNGEQTSRDSES